MVCVLSTGFQSMPAPRLEDLEPAIRAALGSGASSKISWSTSERQQLTALYSDREFAPLWVDASGRPSADAREALQLLSNAAAEGLDPDEYSATMLTERAGEADTRAPPQAGIGAFDVALSGSVLRYFRHVHAGRMDPRTIGFRMTTPADDDDLVTTLRDALAQHRVGATAAGLVPPLVLYRALRAMLARYRLLAADRDLAHAPPLTKGVRPGQPYDALGGLIDRLVALDDLPADMPRSERSGTYDDRTADGVKHFQLRHGLQPDGVLGAATLAALRVPLEQRVPQIELALERLRWLPHLSPNRFLAVNIPMFRLWVWNNMPPNGAPAFGMNVIVGRALNRQTPVFVEEMQEIIFRPYWNVPVSIVRAEILPAVRQDPSYLEQHDMEIVSNGIAGDPQLPMTDATLLALQEGRLRVRQRPGPTNALGLVKFVFPNDVDVYLHDTPSPELFNRSRRDFSHGCVRVADPVGLAEWALAGQADWTRDKILAAMHGDTTTVVKLDRPIQVVLFYVTAVVMPEDGTVHFADDVYGHDARLMRALGAHAGNGR
jgi:L,D-transpeptidase YcbB